MGFTRQLLLHWLLSTRWKLIQEQQVFYLRRQKRDKTSNGYIDLLIQYYLSNRPHFLWVYRRDNPRGMLGEHENKLVNHEPKASDLQAFRVFSQHPKWVITPVNP